MTSLGRNVFAGTLNASNVITNSLSIGSVTSALSTNGAVTCERLWVGSDYDGSGLHVINRASTAQEGSLLIHRYEQTLNVTTITVDATSVATLTVSGHRLSVGDTFYIDPSYDPTWTYRGLSASHLVGEHEVSEVVNSTQVRMVLSVSADSSGADFLAPAAPMSVFRYLYIDMCDMDAGWVSATTPPVHTHQNTSPQLYLT